MILAALALSVATLGLEELPQQKPQPGRCIVMLWLKTAAPLRIAMLDEASRTLHLQRHKQPLTLPEATNGYGNASLHAQVDVRFAENDSIRDGALVESGSLTLSTPAGESLILPVGGMRACL